MKEILLRTKLSHPKLRLPLVIRPQLISKLNHGLNGKLILVSAPAGFGKTTLTAAWARHLRQEAEGGAAPSLPSKIGWLSLDDHDDDLARFLIALTAAVASLGESWSAVGLDDEVLAYFLNSHPPAVETLLRMVINTIVSVPQSFALVLDDYQVINTKAIHEALAFLLEHMPPQMHLVICTRVDPPLPIPLLRSRGQLVEIRQRDLQFTIEEAAQFLEQLMGSRPEVEDVAAITARTEGWAAGLQMAAVAWQNSADRYGFVPAFTGSHRHILDFFSQEVLRRQPQDIQDFLLKTSILDRLTAPLCAALFASGEKTPAQAQMLLEQIEASNLFIVPLDDERRWYRYHRLFSDLLRHLLSETQAETLAVLHRRASQWLEQNGALSEAVDHAIAAGDFDRAARLLEESAEEMLMRSEIGVLLRWLETLPGPLIQARPSLCIYHAWSLLLSGRSIAAVNARLQDAEKAGISAEISAVAAVFKALVVTLLGDAPRSLELSQQALERLPADSLIWRSTALSSQGMAYVLTGDTGAAIEAFRESVRIGQEAGHTMIVVGGLSNLAGLCMARGQLHQSAASYRRALEYATDTHGRLLPIAHRVLLGLGELAREWNDLPAAEGYFNQSLELSRQFGDAGSLMSIIHLARVAQSQGKFDQANEMLDDARYLARETDATQLDDLLVEGAQGRLWLQQGNFAAIERWARDRGLDQPMKSGMTEKNGSKTPPIYDLWEVEQLILARLAIARGQTSQALALLEPLGESAEQRGQMRRLIEILNLQALAYQVRGDTAHALAAIRQALILAAPEGYIRTFVDIGEPLLPLLSTALSQEITPDYTRRLLAAFPESAAYFDAQISLDMVEPLSSRELEVLQLIAEGCSNRDIAERLVISLSTVKGHTSNIFGKLGIHRRTQAVARARELDLLP